MNEIDAILCFLQEIDKVKNIIRHSLVSESLRRENDAEHAWHLAMMVISLKDYAAEPIDVLKTVKMVLIHDIVEIDAGDVFLYDVEARAAQKEKERQAANRIFGMLPQAYGYELISLWEEFEERKTPEAKFGAALDRFQPIRQNFFTQGRTWKKHKVTKEMVLKANAIVAEGAPALWEKVKDLVDAAVKLGYLSKS